MPRITGLPLRIEQLEPLALADRVVAEHGHAVLGQQDARPADSLVRLAVVAVAARHEHAGKRRLAVGEIEIRRDVVIGPALEDDLLDAVAVALAACRRRAG